jgi:hypothetical protein
MFQFWLASPFRAIGGAFRRGSRSTRYVWICAVSAWLAAGLVLLAATRPERNDHSPAVRSAPSPVSVPPGSPPAVPSTELLPVTAADARAINAAIPFMESVGSSARPFIAQVGSPDFEKALVCLAAAAFYEAGDDPIGGRAVIQVVLNRVRHPAYPKTVCGVVLQGSERRTGCQFTFTCDGALSRRPSIAAWQRASDIARKALTGFVAPEVGLATHYHTDWVVPYWSGSLDKIARVGTHLFFRWKGWWGTSPAFRGGYAGGERVDDQLPGAASLAESALGNVADPALSGHNVAVTEPMMVTTVDIPGIEQRDLKGSVLRLADLDTNSFVLQLRPGAFPGDWATSAVVICRGRPNCMVLGYLQPDRVPASLPIPREHYIRASFLYRRGADASSGRAFWHCGQVANIDPAQCVPGTERAVN